jgi:hypothetical protein
MLPSVTAAEPTGMACTPAGFSLGFDRTRHSATAPIATSTPIATMIHLRQVLGS